MKLLNNTKIPDDLLEAVLLRAGRSVRARTSNVVVQVNPAYRCLASRGMTHGCFRVRWQRGSRRWMITDGGAFRISLVVPSLHSEWRIKRYDPLTAAESFFRVARHEWGHIHDYQAKEFWRVSFSREQGGRRPPHDARPEEIRTENYANEADEKDRGAQWAQEEILALAVALEERKGGT